MIQVTNMGQGDADLLVDADDDSSKGALKLVSNSKAMETNAVQNTNLLAGLLANLGNITGMEKEGDTKQQASDGQAKIEEIAAKLNKVDDSVRATVSESKKLNPEQQDKESAEAEEIIEKESKPISVGTVAEKKNFSSLIAHARPKP